MSKDIVCHNCGLVNDYTEVPAGPHRKAICNGCDRYIKFLPKEGKVMMFHFGKYKGKLIDYIEDRQYLEWIMQQEWFKDKALRQAIEIRIEQLKSKP